MFRFLRNFFLKYQKCTTKKIHTRPFRILNNPLLKNNTRGFATEILHLCYQTGTSRPTTIIILPEDNRKDNRKGRKVYHPCHP